MWVCSQLGNGWYTCSLLRRNLLIIWKCRNRFEVSYWWFLVSTREVGEVGEGVCSRDFPSLNLLDRISPNRFSGIRRSFTRPLPTRPQSWSCCARSTGSRSAMRGNRCGDLTEISTKKLNTQISPKSRPSFWDPTKCGCVAEIRCKEVWSSAFFFGVLAGSFWSSQEPHQKVEADAGDVELGQLGKDAISDGSSRDSCESRERLPTTRTANDWILVACLMGDTERLSIQSRWTNWSSLSKGPSGFCPDFVVVAEHSETPQGLWD